MKTVEITLYKFAELSDEAQQKAIEKLLDINVDYEWWEFTYEDAKRIGLEITSFDLDRNLHAKGDLLWSAPEIANKIITEHGESCDTYSLAKTFLTDYDKLVEKYSDGKDLTRVAEDNECDFDNDADELEEDFRKDLLEEYAQILSKEYYYLTSKESIIESIESNDYDFTEDGELY